MGDTEPEHLLVGQEGATVLNELPREASHRKRSSGFNLIELMVTLTLLGILVALGLPSFTAWIRNQQIRSVTESLQVGLRMAQTESIRRNRTVVLSFTNAAPALGAAAVAGGKNWSLETVPQFGEAAGEYITGGALSDVASGVAIDATPAAAAICFNSNGRVITNSGKGCAAANLVFDVTQANADRPLRLILQVGGQLRMCDPHRPVLSSATPDGCPA